MPSSRASENSISSTKDLTVSRRAHMGTTKSIPITTSDAASETTRMPIAEGSLRKR